MVCFLRHFFFSFGFAFEILSYIPAFALFPLSVYFFFIPRYNISRDIVWSHIKKVRNSGRLSNGIMPRSGWVRGVQTPRSFEHGTGADADVDADGDADANNGDDDPHNVDAAADADADDADAGVVGKETAERVNDETGGGVEVEQVRRAEGAARKQQGREQKGQQEQERKQCAEISGKRKGDGLPPAAAVGLPAAAAPAVPPEAAMEEEDAPVDALSLLATLAFRRIL
jgi:hypothetical protein